MIKKTAIIFLVLAALVISAINVNAYSATIIIDDEINDVIHEDAEGNILENQSYPNVDIDELKCVQTDRKVEITLKLEQAGKIESSLLTYYMITLVTTDEDGGYMLLYSSEIAAELEGTDPIWIMDGKGEWITPLSFSGVGTNTLSVSFNLKSSNERAISIEALVAKEMPDGSSYFDMAPNDFDESTTMNLEPNAGNSYNTTVGETLQLSGSLAEGDPSDYTWLWIIDDTSIQLEGQNPTRVFIAKENYTGILYVYDGQGNWGMDYFEINVLAKSSSQNGDGGNDQPGFELIVVIAAVAIALLIFRKKKK